MWSTLVWILVTVLVLVIAGTAAWGGLRAAPYLPTRTRDVERMLRLANLQPGEKVYDLGAGDGRFIIAAVKQFHATAIGYEISLLPFLVGVFRIWFAGVKGQAKMSFHDFFHADISDANVVVCFLTPGAMKKLGPMFRQQLPPGTRIVSYAFSIDGWEPVVKDKPEQSTFAVYLYRV